MTEQLEKEQVPAQDVGRCQPAEASMNTSLARSGHRRRYPIDSSPRSSGAGRNLKPDCSIPSYDGFISTPREY
jgi:hypothetical protein